MKIMISFILMSVKNWFAILLLNLVLLAPTPIFAQSPTKTNLQSQRLTDIHTRCDDAISQRLTSLNDDLNRINNLTKLSTDSKTKFASLINANLGGLNSQKVKCDGDTDLSILKTDYKNVFLDFRIYAVFLPQTNILVAADTMGVTADQLQGIYNKLQIRVGQIGNPASLTKLLDDMQSKITDTKTQYTNAQNAVSNLTPQSFNSDPNGTKTSEQNALIDIKTGAQDLKAAFQDAKQIRTGLKTSASPTP